MCFYYIIYYIVSNVSYFVVHYVVMYVPFESATWSWLLERLKYVRNWIVWREFRILRHVQVVLEISNFPNSRVRMFSMQRTIAYTANANGEPVPFLASFIRTQFSLSPSRETYRRRPRMR